MPERQHLGAQRRIVELRGLDVGGAIAWMRKAQGLLNSDVVSLPVAEVLAASHG